MKYELTYEEAVSLLPEGDSIHTFINGYYGLIGADWSRDDILGKLKEAEKEFSKFTTRSDNNVQ